MLSVIMLNVVAPFFNLFIVIHYLWMDSSSPTSSGRKPFDRLTFGRHIL
jgi:hypothetical protein